MTSCCYSRRFQSQGRILKQLNLKDPALSNAVKGLFQCPGCSVCIPGMLVVPMILCTLSSLFMVWSCLVSGRQDFQAPVLLQKDLTLTSTVLLGSFWDPSETSPCNPNLIFSGSKNKKTTTWRLPQAKLEASASHQQSVMCSQSCRKMSSSAAVWTIAKFLDHSGDVSDCGTQG